MIFPRIITLSGIDGAGKSTIAQLLYKKLNQQGRTVRIIHIGSMLQGPSEIQRRLPTIMGIFILLKDYIQILFHTIRFIGSREILIFDRFLYDTLVKIAYKTPSNSIKIIYIRLIRILFPFSHLAILLVLPPTISQKRDNHHTIRYHTVKTELYESITKYISMYTIEAVNSTHLIIEEILKKI